MFTKEQIFEEVKKIEYLFGLKYEIRYAQERGDETESVAEHIYAMHVLAHYFLPLEDKNGSWNRERIFSMITWHDMDELETGDMIGYKKTPADRAREETAMQEVIEKLPTHLKEAVVEIANEYQKQETIESRFVKALDKIEPLFHLFNEAGKRTLQRNKTTYTQNRSIKDPYVKEFPYLSQFNETISSFMHEHEFFYEDGGVR